MKRLAALAVLSAGLAHAQCVMCYRTAHAQNQERARVLNLGILILGGPPILLFGGFVWYLFRRDEDR